MIKDAAVRRVETTLAGHAVRVKPPRIATPLNPLKVHDPVLLAVYHFMIGHNEANRGEPFKNFTRDFMAGSRSSAANLGISIDESLHDVQLFGTKLRLLTPDFLLLGLKFEFKHRNKGSWIEVTWAEGFPIDLDKEYDGDKPSTDKPGQVKPLQRSDGRDDSELLSRFAAKQINGEETQS